MYRSYLYGAVLDKPKLYAGGGGPGAAAQGKQAKANAATAQSAPIPSKSKARVIRTQTDKEVLNNLIQRWKSFKLDVSQVFDPGYTFHCESF